MNFFKLYIGDYQRDTAHLSITEHGAYVLMLQHLYATERPLPTGKALYRMLRADRASDKEAIDSIVRQFWVETEDGLVNERAEEEIQKGEHQRTVNREIGKLGGRPKKTDSVNGSVTETKTDSVTAEEPNNNPLQTPDSNKTKKPAKRIRTRTTIPDDFSLDDGMREAALRRYPDADAEEMVRQFVAHHASKGTLMASWRHAWTTWLGNAERFGYPKRRAGNGIHATVVMR